MSSRQATWLLSKFPLKRYQIKRSTLAGVESVSNDNHDKDSSWQRVHLTIELYSRTLLYDRNEVVDRDIANNLLPMDVHLGCHDGASTTAIASAHGFSAVLALLSPRERARVVHLLGREHLGGLLVRPIPDIRWDCVHSFSRHTRIMAISDSITKDGNLSVFELHHFLQGQFTACSWIGSLTRKKQIYASLTAVMTLS